MSAHRKAASSQEASWSKAAIACIILAVLGFMSLWLLVGLFLSAVAVVCGHLARFHVETRQLKGKGLATFGLGLGYVSMIFFPVIVLIVALSFPAASKWRSNQGESQKRESRRKVSELYIACEEYASDNFNRYPVAWEELSGRYVPSHRLPDLLKSPYAGGMAEAFEMVPHERPVLDAIKDSVIVIQELAPSNIPEVSVVYANGKTATLNNPDYQGP